MRDPALDAAFPASPAEAVSMHRQRLCERLRKGCRSASKICFREAYYGPTVKHQGVVPRNIAVPGLASRMKLETLGLDSHLGAGPSEVNGSQRLLTFKHHVLASRPWQTKLPEESQRASLQLTFCIFAPDALLH